MAQLAETDSFSETRWGFREEVLQFLETLKHDLKPLEGRACLIMGDAGSKEWSQLMLMRRMPEENKLYGFYWSMLDECTLNMLGEGLSVGFVGNCTSKNIRSAHMLLEHLHLKGYRTDWDGNPDNRILIKTPTLVCKQEEDKPDGRAGTVV